MALDQAYKIRTKPITTPAKKPDEAQIRDTFQTPKYAVDLLIPFIPKHINNVWEPACGEGKIVQALELKGYRTWATDIRFYPDWVDEQYNFLDENPHEQVEDWVKGGKLAIVTNPPFSVKDDFIEKAFTYHVPFAFLINADYSGQSVEWIRRGCEKIVPTSRIAYITPNILRRIHEGEVWNLVKNDYQNHTFKTIKESGTGVWRRILEKYEDVHNYKSIDDVPNVYLYKYSSAQFHSMWLTYGFNIGKTETFVDLTVEERKNNI